MAFVECALAILGADLFFTLFFVCALHMCRTAAEKPASVSRQSWDVQRLKIIENSLSSPMI